MIEVDSERRRYRGAAAAVVTLLENHEVHVVLQGAFLWGLPSTGLTCSRQAQAARASAAAGLHS